MALLLGLAVASCDDPAGEIAPDEQLPEPGESFDDECTLCHGNSLGPAPPRGIDGATETTAMGVGAHDSHLALSETSTWHAPVACASCHLVPAETGSPGHIDDGDNRAELTFGDIAKTGGLTPTLGEDGRCSDVYCHGATLSGGSLGQPLWTLVDGSQRECGTCHGFPPPAPHPANETCGACHPTLEPGSGSVFLDPSRHINGTVETNEEQSDACDACHGSDGTSAPPLDLSGNTDRSSRGVGAHRVHLSSSAWRREINCSNCHVVPENVTDPAHIDGDNQVEVPFDAFNPLAAVDPITSRCSNLYCHGNGRANNGSATWTSTTPLDCDSCHKTPAPGESGSGMSGGHDRHIRVRELRCYDCHGEVVDAATNVISPQRHVDAQRNVMFPMGGDWNPATARCTNLACHNDKKW